MIAGVLGELSRSLLAHPVRWGACTFAVTGLLVWPASRLALRLDEDDFLPARSSAPEAAPLPHASFVAGRRVAVVLEADAAIPLQDVDRIFTFVEGSLRQVPGVAAVRARLSPTERQLLAASTGRNALLSVDPSDLRAIQARLTPEGLHEALAAAAEAGGTTPGGHGVRRVDPLGLLGVVSREAQRWQGLARIGLRDGYLEIPGRHAFLMIIESRTSLDAISEARVWTEAIDRELGRARNDAAVGPLLAGKRLYGVGGRFAAVATFDALYHDVVRVSAAAAIVVALLLGFFYRSPFAPFVLLLPVAVGILAAAAIGALVFGSVSLIAWVFIGLMVGLGVDAGIHVATHYWMLADPGVGRSASLAHAITTPGPAIVVAGLTSAAALAFIAAIPYPVTREIAWLTSSGILATLAGTLTVLPLALLASRPGVRMPNWWAKALAPFWRPPRVPPLLAALPWFLLLAVAVMLGPSMPFESHPWSLLGDASADMDRLETLGEELGASLTPLVVLSTASSREEVLELDRLAVRQLQRIAPEAGVGYIESLSRWLPDVERQRENRRTLAAAGLSPTSLAAAAGRVGPLTPYLADQYLPRVAVMLEPDDEFPDLADLERPGLDELVDRHLIEGDGGYVAASFVYLRRSPWSPGAVARFVDAATASGALRSPGVSLAGRPLRTAQHATAIRDGIVRALLISGTIVGALLWLRFRRAGPVLLCLAPALCGVAAALLLVDALHWELSLLILVVGPILVGIGVDDGIHVVERLGRGQNLETALREAGPGMLLTTVTTVGAFACLTLSIFPAVRELGVVGGAGMLTSLLASLHLVPCGWRLIGGRRPQRMRRAG